MSKSDIKLETSTNNDGVINMEDFTIDFNKIKSVIESGNISQSNMKTIFKFINRCKKTISEISSSKQKWARRTPEQQDKKANTSIEKLTYMIDFCRSAICAPTVSTPPNSDYINI